MTGPGSLGNTYEICSPDAQSGAEPHESADACQGSEITEKTRVGLVRARLTPRGTNPENFDKSGFAVYRRFLRWQRLRTVQHLMRQHRVRACFRSLITVKRENGKLTSINPAVQVFYSPKVNRAHYGGLKVCGSVWVCPVCAAKITERRRAELEGANVSGLSLFMVTYTMQHRQADKLKALLDDLANGLRDMKHSKGYKSFMQRWQIVGAVTGLEIMVSDSNGWHPHKHALMFSTLPQNKINVDTIKRELVQLYITAMTKRGRYVHDDVGLNVRAGKDIKREYIAKFGEDEKSNTWSLQAEITKSPVKTGREADHFHPFELIDMYQSGNLFAGKKYSEYADAMKGKKQLVFTRKLRARLGLDVDISDQEIAERQDQDAQILALLSAEDWAHVLKHEKRGQLLEVASTGNYNSLVVWMRAIGRVQFGS